MQLQNIECQIAKAQIGRYLAGDALSDETVSQLEGHIATCPDCKQNLAERRSVLQAMLSPTETEPSENQKSKIETPKSERFDLADFIKSKVQTKQPVQAVARTTEVKPNSFWKPALYSLGLGAVLIGMSYASKNLGSLLGSKVAENPAAVTSTTAKPPVATAIEPDSRSIELLGKATGASADALINSAPEPTDLPKPAVKTSPVTKAKPVQTKPKSAPVRHKHKSPRPSTNSIRVYEPESNP